MNKLNAIIQNPDLEQNIINFVAFRHMQEHWQEHIDPTLPYETHELELFYSSMRRSAMGDLRKALREDHGISSKDPDFQQILDAAIGIIVARHGIDAIVASAKEFLHIFQEPPMEAEAVEMDFTAPSVKCIICNKQAIPLGLEDLPESIAALGGLIVGDLFGYCGNCKKLFQSR